MFTLKDVQNKILELKKEKNACILAHCYQTHDILEIADFTGDSFGLARKAAGTDCETVIMCGVRFMAETCKILSPGKRVFLPRGEAGCPMAEQLTPGELARLKEQYPGYKTAAYINTAAELKTMCDVCVTSSSAVDILRRIDGDRILFIPDCNLGAYVQSQIPEKEFVFVNGGCPIHARLTLKDVEAARAAHPGAQLLLHPECRPEVTAAADFAGSTTEIMDYARESGGEEFIIGTDNSIVQHLSIECPDKMFYALSKDCFCHNMKITSITDVLHCLEGRDGEEITLSPDIISKARVCIDEMLRLG